jgi:hypothetical protein
MTYIVGGSILAADYNTFSTLAGGMNEIFADLYPGATTLPTAGFGYGQTPALTAVAPGGSITAAQWTALFQTIRKSGLHQGTAVVPPLPGSDPVPGGSIIAYNTPTALASLISTLGTNRFNLALGQSTLTAGSNFVQPAGAKPWTNTLTFNYQVNFGSWNNARYFFNSGGTLNLNGAYSPNSTPEDAQWISMFATMSPLVFDRTTTVPFSGTNAGTGAGFYGLSTVYQNVYLKAFGSGYYYSNSTITLRAKLNAAAGTNGIIDFQCIMTDADTSPNAKTSTTTYRIDNRSSAGAIVYPGSVTISSVGANSGFVAT